MLPMIIHVVADNHTRHLDTLLSTVMLLFHPVRIGNITLISTIYNLDSNNRIIMTMKCFLRENIYRS